MIMNLLNCSACIYSCACELAFALDYVTTFSCNIIWCRLLFSINIAYDNLQSWQDMIISTLYILITGTPFTMFQADESLGGIHVCKCYRTQLSDPRQHSDFWTAASLQQETDGNPIFRKK